MDNPRLPARLKFGRRVHGADPALPPRATFVDYLKKLRRKYWPEKVGSKGKRLGYGRSKPARPGK